MKDTDENKHVKHISTSSNMFNTMSLNSLYNMSFDFLDSDEKEVNDEKDDNLNKGNYPKHLEWLVPLLAFFQNSKDVLKENIDKITLKFTKNYDSKLRSNCNDVYKFEFNKTKGKEKRQINFFDNDKSPFNNISSIENKELGKYISNLLKSSLEDDTFYTVDRIEDSIVVLENRNNLKMVNIDKNNIPFDIVEGDILYYSKGNFKKDTIQRKKLEDTINKKMDNLWE